MSPPVITFRKVPCWDSRHPCKMDFRMLVKQELYRNISKVKKCLRIKSSASLGNVVHRSWAIQTHHVFIHLYFSSNIPSANLKWKMLKTASTSSEVTKKREERWSLWTKPWLSVPANYPFKTYEKGQPKVRGGHSPAWFMSIICVWKIHIKPDKSSTILSFDKSASQETNADFKVSLNGVFTVK